MWKAPASFVHIFALSVQAMTQGPKLSQGSPGEIPSHKTEISKEETCTELGLQTELIVAEATLTGVYHKPYDCEASCQSPGCRVLMCGWLVPP